MRKRIGGLILAAGCSKRMGDFKPLMPLRGKTLIENSIDSMLLCGVDPIVVVLGHRGQDMEAILKSRYLGDTLTLVYNQDYTATDMLTSVKLGLASMPPCDAFFLLPGDMPVVAKETFLAVYRAMPEFGAVADTVLRYCDLEAMLVGKTVEKAKAEKAALLKAYSERMVLTRGRVSAEYRKTVCMNLLSDFLTEKGI